MTYPVVAHDPAHIAIRGSVSIHDAEGSLPSGEALVGRPPEPRDSDPVVLLHAVAPVFVPFAKLGLGARASLPGDVPEPGDIELGDIRRRHLVR